MTNEDEIEGLKRAVGTLAASIAELSAVLTQSRGRILPYSFGKRISNAALETERVARDIATRL